MKVRSQLEALTIFNKYAPKAVIDIYVDKQTLLGKVGVFMPIDLVSKEDRARLRQLGWHPVFARKDGTSDHWVSTMTNFT